MFGIASAEPGKQLIFGAASGGGGDGEVEFHIDEITLHQMIGSGADVEGRQIHRNPAHRRAADARNQRRTAVRQRAWIAIGIAQRDDGEPGGTRRGERRAIADMVTGSDVAQLQDARRQSGDGGEWRVTRTSAAAIKPDAGAGEPEMITAAKPDAGGIGERVALLERQDFVRGTRLRLYGTGAPAFADNWRQPRTHRFIVEDPSKDSLRRRSAKAIDRML